MSFTPSARDGRKYETSVSPSLRSNVNGVGSASRYLSASLSSIVDDGEHEPESGALEEIIEWRSCSSSEQGGVGGISSSMASLRLSWAWADARESVSSFSPVARGEWG